jgi:nifR3 family TIM-barrel protein
MTASDDLANGRPMSVLRCEATGIGPHVVQLAGCQTHWMAEGARIAEAAGADIIDINMGCPARHVTGGQSGSALMRDLDHALRLIEATISAVKVPVTLKMRLGWDDRSLNAPEIARRAEAAGVQMITVHGRTRCQFYKGEADWSAVRAVRDAISLPLVVNGDITSYEKAVNALEMSGADAVMIGRGAQGQPWLPGQIGRRLETGTAESPPSLAEQLKHIRALYDEVCSLYGLRIGLKHARKHLGWALEIAAQCSRAPAATLKNWRQKILTADEPSSVHRSLEDAFDDFAWSAAA